MTRHSRALTSAVLALAFLACDDGAPARATVAANATSGEIPFRLTGAGGAVLLVQAYVNGQGPFDLVLDTGATLTCLDEQLVSELGLREAAGAFGYGAGVGGSGRVALVRLDSLRVGPARTEQLMACVLDLQHLQSLRDFRATDARVDGLLGLNFLRNFLVTLDFERNVLLLR